MPDNSRCSAALGGADLDPVEVGEGPTLQPLPRHVSSGELLLLGHIEAHASHLSDTGLARLGASLPYLSPISDFSASWPLDSEGEGGGLKNELETK